MALINSIKNFTFVMLQGTVAWHQQSAEVIARPGVDGLGLLRTGSRGEEFALRSIVDAPDYPTAVLELRGYEALRNGDAVMLVQENLPMGLVFVLDVRPVVCRAIVGAVGGINPPSGALLVCDWRLVAAGP